MIFPEDYKTVGIKDDERPGDLIYFSTEYLISRNGPRLYRVTSPVRVSCEVWRIWSLYPQARR